MSETRFSPPASSGRPSLFTVLATYAVSEFGLVVRFVAVPWFVLELTGSASRAGLTAAVSVLPLIIGGLFGGVIVDRVGFKRSIVSSDLVSGLSIAAIPLLHATIGIEFWQLLIFVFLSSLLETPGRTARESLFPELARSTAISLERINAVAETTARIALLLGPPATGFLIAIIGSGTVLWVTTFALCASALWIAIALPGEASIENAIGEGRKRHYWTELLEAIQFIRGNSVVLWLTLTIVFITFLEAHLTIALPVYANQVLGDPVALGVMFTGLGIGSLAGAVAYAAVAPRIPRFPLFLGGLVVITISYGMLASTPQLPIIIAALVLLGLAAAPLNSLIATIFQERTPSALRGRVLGLIGVVPFAAMAAGRFLAGYQLERFGVETTLLFVTGGYVVITIVITLMPGLRQIEAVDPDKT